MSILRNPVNSQQMIRATSLTSWPGHLLQGMLYNSLTFNENISSWSIYIHINPPCTNHSILLQIVDPILHQIYYCIVCVLRSTLINNKYKSLLNAKQFIQLLGYKYKTI